MDAYLETIIALLAFAVLMFFISRSVRTVVLMGLGLAAFFVLQFLGVV
jgi:hypothetical protein